MTTTITARAAYVATVTKTALALAIMAQEEYRKAVVEAFAAYDGGRPGAAAVAALRRVAVRPATAIESRRPATETAALLVNAYDGGYDAAERAARRWDIDAVEGVPFADRVDARPWFLNVMPDGTEMWQTIPDDVEF
jgi:hypothetical protein